MNVTGYTLTKDDWERAQRLKLHPWIESPQDYLEAVDRGEKKAREFLANEVGEISRGQLKKVHELIFSEIHPWAGEFREPGQGVEVGEYGPAGKVEDIIPDLEALEKKQRDHVLKEFSQEMDIKMAAEVHCEIVRIQPFLDGNKRVGRLILDHQLDHSFGKEPWQDLQPDQYANAVERAVTKGDSDLMTAIVTECVERTREASLERGDLKRTKEDLSIPPSRNRHLEDRLEEQPSDLSQEETPQSEERSNPSSGPQTSEEESRNQQLSDEEQKRVMEAEEARRKMLEDMKKQAERIRKQSLNRSL